MEIKHGDCPRLRTIHMQGSEKNVRVTHRFDPPDGHEFVLMLLGTAPKDQPADIDMMLSKLGFVFDGGSEEIARLNGVIADLEAKLAAKD
jgi:hypothetical protein